VTPFFLKGAARSGHQGTVLPSALAPTLAPEDVRRSRSAPVEAVATAAAGFDVERAYAEHAPFLARVIQRLLGDAPQVDDLLQETFIVAFRKRGEFRGDAAERTWLYAIATHLCLRHRRGARRFDALRRRFAGQPDRPPARPDDDLEREERAAFVRAILLELPFAQREVFALYELEGLDGRAIAELLAIPIGTVWTRLHHGRERFQRIARQRLAREVVR
jgi:RNA polymerase sigma-70 factor (ECF subfamily)